jgi:hypothetical protein
MKLVSSGIGVLALTMAFLATPVHARGETVGTAREDASNGVAARQESGDPKSAQNTRAHPPQRTGLESRIRLLTAELDLDADQQTEVRKILLQQAAAVSRVWNDESMPAATRIAATGTIGNETEDRIRALLTAEQKKRYNLPKSEHPLPADPSRRSVEEWMRATNPGGAQRN